MHKIYPLLIIFILTTIKINLHADNEHLVNSQSMQNFSISYYSTHEIFSGVIEKSIDISPIDKIAIIRVYEFFKTNHTVKEFNRYVLITDESRKNFQNGEEYLFYTNYINKKLLSIAPCNRSQLLANSLADVKIFYSSFGPQNKRHMAIPGFEKHDNSNDSFASAFARIFQNFKNFVNDLIFAIKKLF